MKGNYTRAVTSALTRYGEHHPQMKRNHAVDIYHVEETKIRPGNCIQWSHSDVLFGLVNGHIADQCEPSLSFPACGVFRTPRECDAHL